MAGRTVALLAWKPAPRPFPPVAQHRHAPHETAELRRHESIHAPLPPALPALLLLTPKAIAEPAQLHSSALAQLSAQQLPLEAPPFFSLWNPKQSKTESSALLSSFLRRPT